MGPHGTLVMASFADDDVDAASGSFNSMVTHRVRLAAPADVDKELVGWLKRAYDGA